MTIARELLPERKCEGCSNQDRWGCEQDAQMPLQLDGELLLRCPLRPFLVNPSWFNEIMFQYNFYKEGHWPEAGTWKDQSARLLVFFYTIDKALRDAKETNQQRQAATAAKKAKKTGTDPYANRKPPMTPR